MENCDMAEAEPVFWGVRAGEASQAESLFLNQNFVALGWPRVGDLRAIKADREAFKAKVTEAYPDKQPGAIANHAGQLLRFVLSHKYGLASLR
jgi:restriction system protein